MLNDSELPYFNRLFPFHFVLDRELAIVRKGPSLLKLIPEAAKFQGCFQFVRPGMGIEYTFDSIRGFEKQLFILRLTSDGKNVLFKGEFVYHAETDRLIFCGSPWLQTDNDLVTQSLNYSDFALHDSIVDLVSINKQHELSTQDIVSLNQQLSEALQKNKDLSRFPLENPNPVARYNRDGSLLFGNQSFHENVAPYIDLTMEIKRMVETGENAMLDLNVNGRSFLAMFVPVRGFGYVNLYCSEITAQKVAEDKLRASEANFRYIVETTNQLIISFNPALKANWMNQRFSELTGFSNTDEPAFFTLFENKTLEPVLAKLLALKNDKQHEHFEGRIKTKEGTIIDIEGVAYFIQKQNGEFDVDFYLNDISEKRKYLANIEAQRAYFADLFDNLPVDVAVLDTDFRFQFVNKSAVKNDDMRKWMIGKREIDYFRFRGLPIEKALDRERRFERMVNDKTADSWEDIYNEGQANEKVMLRNMLPIFSDDKLVYILAYGIDITQIKKGRDQLNSKNSELEKLNKDLDSFVYSASHDLRAPLLSMLGLLDVINRQSHIDPQTAGYMGMMRGVILRLDDTIKDILSYSKNSRIEVVNKPIQLKPLVESIFQGVRNFLTRDIRLEVDIQGDSEFWSDEVRMKSLLNNLISNAIKYSRESTEGSWVRVNAHVGRDSCTLSVEDNGEGIPIDKQAKVFDMFYRASKNSQGSGLGLYICSEILKKLDGKIELESIPGQGTKFTLTLPNHPQAASHAI